MTYEATILETYKALKGADNKFSSRSLFRWVLYVSGHYCIHLSRLHGAAVMLMVIVRRTAPEAIRSAGQSPRSWAHSLPQELTR